MTKEEVIKLLQEEVERCKRAPELNGCEMTEEWQRTMDVCLVAVEAIREQEQRRWIPVSDRMPRNYIPVLCYIPSLAQKMRQTVHECHIGADGEWHSATAPAYREEVTHWMPMPEPPNGENEVASMSKTRRHISMSVRGAIGMPDSELKTWIGNLYDDKTGEPLRSVREIRMALAETLRKLVNR